MRNLNFGIRRQHRKTKGHPRFATRPLEGKHTAPASSNIIANHHFNPRGKELNHGDAPPLAFTYMYLYLFALCRFHFPQVKLRLKPPFQCRGTIGHRHYFDVACISLRPCAVSVALSLSLDHLETTCLARTYGLGFLPGIPL